MKNIVVLLRNYKPYNSAIGICMSNVIDILKKNAHIYVICEKTKINEENREIIEGETVIRFLSRQSYFRKKNENKIESSEGFKKKWYFFMLQMIRFAYNIKFLLSKHSIQTDLADCFFTALESIPDKIDMIVPTCMPVESLMAAHRYCSIHKEVFFLPVLFDKFADNGTLHRFTFNKKLKWKANQSIEYEAFSDIQCRKILYVEAWENYLKQNYPQILKKIVLIEHPLLKPITTDLNVNFEKDRINCVYTGTLTVAGRNPLAALEMIKRLHKINRRIKLHVYGSGDALPIVKRFTSEDRNVFELHGAVSSEKAHAAMKNAQILISIGNEDITQTPSKIFEYMSCGKIIIHIAKKEEDPVLEVLRKYPLSLCFVEKKDKIQQQVEEVNDFIVKNLDTHISYEKIREVFPTALPEYTSNLIISEC